MIVLAFLAHVGLAAEDVLVLLSLLASLLLIGWRTANLYTMRRHHGRPLAWCAVLAWLAAAACLVSLAILGRRHMLGGLIAEIRPVAAATVLLVSLALLVATRWVDTLGDRRRLARRLAVARWR